MAPELFNYTWLLYKSGYDLIGIANKYMKDQGKPMSITITNSPGASVNFVNGNQCLTNNDVFSAASVMQKACSGYADMVTNNKADNILFSTPGQESFVFDSEKYQNYKRYSKKAKESEPVEIQCNITRFNKKTLNGVIEIYEEEEIFIKPFSVSPDIVDDCLEAFKADLVTISAIREVEINALNETSVIRYHAMDISII